ncbi:NUDIX hydrolase [Oceanobacillus sojae]|uniref:NUDIX hydrolase n=1 Tax=Oceanobacillus sojae TaxID=582851 RepID=UPI0009888E28|nr:NUDIX hydrolase [Oceanobacillus sojae]MCT1902930.1 NUDIX hydrolase [Oceanobacillus sojae]
MIYTNVRAFIIRETEQGEEVLVQRRIRSDEQRTPIELPGGRLEEFETLLDCLAREIKEETGLELEKVVDPTDRVETVTNEGFKVECMAPFAVYQTIEGPVDSFGIYFKCKAAGKLLEKGDHTDNIKWITRNKLAILLKEDKLSFVDKAGVQFFLNQKRQLTD